MAVAFGSLRLTYAQLNASANQLAHYLQALGVGPEIPVAVCMDHCPEMVIGVLGIFKAGGAYLPLDPAYPKERLAFMLQDARPPVVFTRQHCLESLPGGGGRVLCLDFGWGSHR